MEVRTEGRCGRNGSIREFDVEDDGIIVLIPGIVSSQKKEFGLLIIERTPLIRE